MKAKTDFPFEIIDLTPNTIADYGVCGYKDIKKHEELQRKAAWFAAYHPKGLRIKALISPTGGYQGMIEYIPGEYAHRPVDAGGYLFIHCLFVGFRKEYKGKGFASALIDDCLNDASAQGKAGVAVVTRKGSFMAKREIFLKKGFRSVAKEKPDFELMTLKFDEASPDPSFKKFSTDPWSKGLYIFRSPQCPYSVKNVEAIMESAREMGLTPALIELDDAEAAQGSPSPFGSFCIVLDGKVLSHHPISNTRFRNIMEKVNG